MKQKPKYFHRFIRLGKNSRPQTSRIKEVALAIMFLELPTMIVFYNFYNNHTIIVKYVLSSSYQTQNTR